MSKCDINSVNHLQSPHCPRERGNSIRERELNVRFRPIPLKKTCSKSL
jgi:hypothetical protein